jgi:hypothetical protein
VSTEDGLMREMHEIAGKEETGMLGSAIEFPGSAHPPVYTPLRQLLIGMPCRHSVVERYVIVGISNGKQRMVMFTM